FRFRLRFWFRLRDCFVLVQTSRARCVGQRLHATVIKITTAIENHLLDSFRDGAFRDYLADATRRVEIAARVDTQILFSRRGRNERLPESIVDHLRVNVVQAAIDREPRTLCVAFYLAANPAVNCSSDFCSTCVCHKLYFRAFTYQAFTYQFCRAST